MVIKEAWGQFKGLMLSKRSQSGKRSHTCTLLTCDVCTRLNKEDREQISAGPTLKGGEMNRENRRQ